MRKGIIATLPPTAKSPSKEHKRTVTHPPTASTKELVMSDKPMDLLGFSHVCIAVSDAERSLAFYKDLLGLDVFFDLSLDGPSMEAVTGEDGARGRMIGWLLGGTVIELLEFSHRDLKQSGGVRRGY